MRFFKLFLPLLMLVATVSSCVTSKEVSYLDDINPNTNIPLNSKFEAVVSPYDQLIIRVIGFGVEKELAEPFNPFGNAQSINNNSNNSGYLVDVNGDIRFPILGNMHVAGMTRLQLQDTIHKRLVADGHMNNPMVDVRFANFRVFVLGTSDGGKVLNITNERCTFLEALAMAGGLNKYTKRDRVAVIREIDGEMVTRYLDPRSASVFNDPFFLLQQNDVIVTQSFQRVYTQDLWNTSVSIVTAVSSLITSVVMIYMLFVSK